MIIYQKDSLIEGNYSNPWSFSLLLTWFLALWRDGPCLQKPRIKVFSCWMTLALLCAMLPGPRRSSENSCLRSFSDAVKFTILILEDSGPHSILHLIFFTISISSMLSCLLIPPTGIFSVSMFLALILELTLKYSAIRSDCGVSGQVRVLMGEPCASSVKTALYGGTRHFPLSLKVLSCLLFPLPSHFPSAFS